MLHTPNINTIKTKNERATTYFYSFYIKRHIQYLKTPGLNGIETLTPLT